MTQVQNPNSLESGAKEVERVPHKDISSTGSEPRRQIAAAKSAAAAPDCKSTTANGSSPGEAKAEVEGEEEVAVASSDAKVDAELLDYLVSSMQVRHAHEQYSHTPKHKTAIKPPNYKAAKPPNPLICHQKRMPTHPSPCC